MSKGNDDKTKEVQRLAGIVSKSVFASWQRCVASITSINIKLVCLNKDQQDSFLQLFFAQAFLDACNADSIKFLDEEQKQQVYETARAEFEQQLVANRLMP